MTLNFRCEEYSYGIGLYSDQYGYVLFYDKNVSLRIDEKNFHILVGTHCLDSDYSDSPDIFAITGRDLDNYPQIVRRTTKFPDPSFQYLEIGAGLGEFIPVLTEKELFSLPIVIDPANYELIFEMLTYLQDKIENVSHLIQLSELVRRCEIFLDTSKVRLVNSILGTALRERPELHGIADVVVDNYGLCHWSATEGFYTDHSVNSIEMKLLKEGGILVQDGALTPGFKSFRKSNGQLVRI